MRKIVLAFAFVVAVSFPLFAGDFIGMDLSIGVGANKDFMDAGITAADLSVSAGLSLFPSGSRILLRASRSAQPSAPVSSTTARSSDGTR